ncbi:AraC family transcriptional regulator [Pigmentiphaga sp. NML080357]|uniref:AraC family transcriptional regulator n=1 Tax=Pigmentiphaga sp. NML080357 TaxID=2008675 RepID=UPI000B40EA31|nr:AraC family transcriptional regulator [Pigmentiphaga sp. NML080357]OVZ57504.1 AraC family transcriptional regulator [Pigmentiphaga sp. NML080357]
MGTKTIPTFSLAQKRFCWEGVGIRSTESAERNMPAHRHSFFQIFFVASGSAVHDIAGRIVQASAGHIFFVSPYTIHQVVFPEDAECYVLYFDAPFLRRGFSVSEIAAQDSQLYALPELAPFVYQRFCTYELDAEATQQMRERCERIRAACERKGILDQAEVRAELTLLLTTVARRYSDEFKRIDKSNAVAPCLDKRARAALSFLQENFDRPLTLSDVAEKVHLTGTYLTHLLKHETGKSFKPLLDQIRLENSKNLLAYTDMPLQKIAISSGFLDHAHFAKRFKAYTRLTPAQFRRQKRRLEPPPEVGA